MQTYAEMPSQSQPNREDSLHTVHMPQLAHTQPDILILIVCLHASSSLYSPLLSLHSPHKQSLWPYDEVRPTSRQTCMSIQGQGAVSGTTRGGGDGPRERPCLTFAVAAGLCLRRPISVAASGRHAPGHALKSVRNPEV